MPPTTARKSRSSLEQPSRALPPHPPVQRQQRANRLEDSCRKAPQGIGRGRAFAAGRGRNRSAAMEDAPDDLKSVLGIRDRGRLVARPLLFVPDRSAPLRKFILGRLAPEAQPERLNDIRFTRRHACWLPRRLHIQEIPRSSVSLGHRGTVSASCLSDRGLRHRTITGSLRQPCDGGCKEACVAWVAAAQACARLSSAAKSRVFSNIFPDRMSS
jgi:hypothetical protein